MGTRDRWILETLQNLTVADELAAGRLFLASTGHMNSGIATNFNFLFENPSASSRIVNIAMLRAFGSGGVGWITVWLNPTTNLPTTARAARNAADLSASPAGNVATLKIGNGAAMSGGTDLDLEFGVPNGASFELPLLGMVLQPGQSIGLSSQYGVGADFAGAVFWTERDA